ncbi:uncharacterized protein LOC132544953 [Ylistrum balloti]|uniref:uncharacterized protein LOC132544953 n=1 Tax=Ylistrum balloti TaxID=509963 RepID=UPI002905A187|nr:uncharacterized protein LOC132544953 [Ylistrum balloti]
MTVNRRLSEMAKPSWWTVFIMICCFFSVSSFSSRVISNVALNKPTSQSSTVQASSRAVDGKVNPPTCMSTSETGYQWWQVDLGSVYTIANVSIQNNIGKPLGYITVETSEDGAIDGNDHLLDARLCNDFTESRPYSGEVIVVPCSNGAIGRFVRISKTVENSDDTLTFCEVVVEVFRDKCNLANIALHKTAIQSSLYQENGALRAVDGNLDPELGGESCMHTRFEDTGQWWQVDFGGLYSVTKVSIQNRFRSADRLSDFVVEISESNATGADGHLENSRLCYKYTEAHVPSSELRSLTCYNDTIGRYLRITKYSDMLHACEVIVEGKPVACLDNACLNIPTIRQGDGQTLQDIINSWKHQLSGTGTRCNFRRKWISERNAKTAGWYWFAEMQ